MGRLFKRYIPLIDDIYICNTCSTHLSTKRQIISKSFHGRGGRAFLVDDVVNVYLGPNETRVLVTGMHVVADINCIECHSLLGWKYKEAHEESQVSTSHSNI
jgi:hypothetical protein